MRRARLASIVAVWSFSSVAWAEVPRAAPITAAAAGAGDARPGVIAAMRAEMTRSMAGLRLKDYEAPYYMAYAVREYEHDALDGRLGAITKDAHRRQRQAWVQVRVGSFDFDNTSNSAEVSMDIDGPELYQPPVDAPIDDDPVALRGTLWLLSDRAYKDALADYAKKRGRRATTVSEDGEEDLPSFAREPAATWTDAPVVAPWDRDKATALVRRLSARFKREKGLIEGEARFSVDRVVRYLVTSEGSEVVTERVIFSVALAAATRAADGMLLEHEKPYYAATFAGLPDEKKLEQAQDQLLAELRGLREAKVVDPYTGPAILMQQAAGVFFHEAVGHRLEGERQNNEKEGRTFKGQIGVRILPEFLSVHDDPTRRTSSGEDLNGYYRYDDEGVAARDVTLIEGGVLRDYLMSRTPIKGSLRSNGHGRAEGASDPMGRMANLVVSSARRVSEAKLRQMLLDEVRRQGKPYGLIIRDITGGATNTTNFGFQAFKGQPRLVYRVDGKTGQETLVRGVEIVGTPLSSINKIVAASDVDGVFNGYCGAESGYVPVSTVAPAVLMTEIELQRGERALERKAVLPAPWEAPAPAGSAN